ncbi:MAG: AMP-binding protein [Polyangiales bacterium]
MALAMNEAIDDGRSTMLFGVPTMYKRFADEGSKNALAVRALSEARLIVSGSAALSVRDHRRIESMTGRGILERYGLTETLIVCAQAVREGSKPGYVGGPLDGVELRLVDEHRGTLVATDDQTLGEVAVRTPSLFGGYLNRPEATAEVADDDDWFYTGDIATRCDDGTVRIVGRRATDLIKTGGYKVGAGEVEACLREVAGVDDVAVVGVPDEDLGERIEAFVVRTSEATTAADTLIEFVAAQLAPHKRPRAVHFVRELPRNAMGKVQKKRLISPSDS